MTPVEWGVVAGAALLVGLVNWWFFGTHPRQASHDRHH